MNGCRCSQCWTLREFLESAGRPEAVWRDLPAAPGHQATTLRVVTLGSDEPVNLVPDVCDGSYVCECAVCTVDRARRVQRGVRPRAA